MIDLQEELGTFTCADCTLHFRDYKHYFAHRKNHITLSRTKVSEQILLEGCCPLCFVKYCKKYKDMCLEELLGSGEKLYEQNEKRKDILRCKYCRKCNEEFRTCDLFFKHAKDVHNDDKPYACLDCNFATSRFPDFKRHWYMHIDYKMYRCHLCPKEYTSKISLDGHLLMSHKGVNIKSYDCPQCDRKYPIPTLLKRHLKAHGPVTEIFKCNLCPKEFPYKQSLKFHMQSHTGEKPHECPYCRKRFTQRFNYRRHLQGHNHILGTLKKCTQCEKQFLTDFLLKRHMQTHEKDLTAFVCDICSKPFSREESLALHKLTHTGNMPFSCEYCDKKFNRIQCYNRHRAIHVDLKPSKCEICGKTFAGLFRVERHIKKVHNRPKEKPLKCSFCSKEFLTKQHFQNHLLKHESKEPYHCEACGKRFMKQEAFRQHINPDRKSKYTLKCKECLKTFKNRNCMTFHKRSHREEISCEFCKRKFLTHDGYEAHLKRHRLKVAQDVIEMKSEEL